MYSPSFYRNHRPEQILDLVNTSSFATVLTPGRESISHLPIVLSDPNSLESDLIGHMARANPHWQDLEKVGQAKVIFHGPHAYISPAWYSPKASNVPTWNYSVVHATGEIQIVRDQIAALKIMNELVSRFEASYKTGWKIPNDEPAILELMGAIVVFKLNDVKYEAKFKMSQKQSSTDRENVIENLKQLESENAQAVAATMDKMSI